MRQFFLSVNYFLLYNLTFYKYNNLNIKQLSHNAASQPENTATISSETFDKNHPMNYYCSDDKKEHI